MISFVENLFEGFGMGTRHYTSGSVYTGMQSTPSRVASLPDYEKVAGDWLDANSRGRLPTPVMRDSWVEYARRLGLPQDLIDLGWMFLTKKRDEFGGLVNETALWKGWFIAQPSLIVTQDERPPGFGFKSRVSDAIYWKALDIIPEFPDHTTAEIVQIAADRLDVKVGEIPGDDREILKLGVDIHRTKHPQGIIEPEMPDKKAGLERETKDSWRRGLRRRV